MTDCGCKTPKTGARGFSMVELLVVVLIIAIMSAVALPNVMGYLRVYKIRGASQQVASEITTARSKAIMKNVNFGAVFVVRSTTTYQWVLEDLPGAAATRQNIGTPGALPAPPVISGALRTLPANIVFGTTCAPPEGGAFTATDAGFRFNRFGGWCDPGAAGCAALPAGSGSALVANNANGGLVCVVETRTTMNRWVSVGPGGRVQVQPRTREKP